MERKARFLFCATFVFALAGCAHNPPKSAAVPPTTTQKACAEVWDLFAKNGAPRPADLGHLAAGCHYQVAEEARFGKYLGRQLEATGWTQDSSSKLAWETPVTRCALQETPLPADHRPHGSVGVSGGTGISPSFGFGINLGSYGESYFDYKIDCLPRK